MAREKTYKTESALWKKVEAYFESISRTEELTDEKGNKILNDSGACIKRRQYVLPPTVGGLCVFLGITRRTWENYAKDEALKPVVEKARARMEAYLEEELLLRRKGIQGVIFNLQNNYGWREKKEIEFGEETRSTAESMSLSQKLAFMKEVAKEFGEGEQLEG